MNPSLVFVGLAYLFLGLAIVSLARLYWLLAQKGSVATAWKIPAKEMAPLLVVILFWPGFCLLWLFVIFRELRRGRS